MREADVEDFYPVDEEPYLMKQSPTQIPKSKPPNFHPSTTNP